MSDYYSTSDEEGGTDFRSKAMEIYNMSGSKAETALAAKSFKKSMRNPTRKIFDEFDADNSGALDESEIATMCAKMGKKLSKKGLAAAMADMDGDGSGEVDFDEFNAWWGANGGKAALDKFPAEGSEGASQAQDQAEFRKMAMALYNQEPGGNEEQHRKMRQTMASKARKVQADARKQEQLQVKEIPLIVEDPDDDYSSSDEDVATKARRAKDREIQRAKAKKNKKFTKLEVKEGAKNAAKGFMAGAAAMVKKIRNEEEEKKLDGNDENFNFVEKRRNLRAMLGDDNFTLKTDEAANMGEETTHHTKWELDFVMMARRKRTVAITCGCLMLFCVIGIPPLVLHLLDASCDAPSELRMNDFSFEPLEVSDITVSNYRGTIDIQATNSTAGNKISVEVESRAVSADALAAISVTAVEEVLSNGRSVIKVAARFDEVMAGSFSLWTCPESHLTIKVPRVSYADARPFGPTLNVTMDGPEGQIILYPWIGNLVHVIGDITIALDASMAFGGAVVTNKLADVSVTSYTGKSLSVFTTVGDIVVREAVLPSAQLVSQAGNVEAQHINLVDLATISGEDENDNLLLSADLNAMATLGYSAKPLTPTLAGVGAKTSFLARSTLKTLHANSASGNVTINNVSHGNVEAHSGTGDVAVQLDTLGFSGYYELHAPFAPQDRGFWDVVHVRYINHSLFSSSHSLVKYLLSALRAMLVSATFVKTLLRVCVGLQETRLKHGHPINRRTWSDVQLNEIDALYINTTLKLEALTASDTLDTLDPLTRLGRVFMHHSYVGNQRLLAESDCGDLTFTMHERLENNTKMLDYIQAN